MLLFLELIWTHLWYELIDNKEKDILILGKGTTQRFSHTLTADTQYSVNFTRSGVLCLSWHYNGNNNFLFVNATKIY